MSTETTCTCVNCAGATCTCGCQNTESARRAGCECGEACACGPNCDCKAA